MKTLQSLNPVPKEKQNNPEEREECIKLRNELDVITKEIRTISIQEIKKATTKDLQDFFLLINKVCASLKRVFFASCHKVTEDELTNVWVQKLNALMTKYEFIIKFAKAEELQPISNITKKVKINLNNFENLIVYLRQGFFVAPGSIKKKDIDISNITNKQRDMIKIIQQRKAMFEANP